jgi:hypothetical protein
MQKRKYVKLSPVSATNPTAWTDNIIGAGGTSGGYAILVGDVDVAARAGNRLGAFGF